MSKSVDFEIIRPDGSIRESGSLDVEISHRVEKVQLHPHNPMLGLFGREAYVGVATVKFPQSLTICDGETLAIKDNHAKLDGSTVGDGNGQTVPGNTDAAPALIPIRPDVRSEQPAPSVPADWTVRPPSESVHTDEGSEDNSGQDERRGGY